MIVDGEGTRQALDYTIAGDRLTISMNVAEMRSLIVAGGHPDTLAVFDVAFRGIDELAFRWDLYTQVTSLTMCLFQTHSNFDYRQPVK